MIGAIKYYSINKMIRWLQLLLWHRDKHVLDIIRKKENVLIHKTFSMGDSSSFNIAGKPKSLVVEENVSCRKYCNYLVFDNAELIIHANVFFNNYCSVNCLERIEIGANTLLGEGVKLYDHNHVYGNANGVYRVERNEYTKAPISIGKNCWIGSNVTILKGVIIGDNVVIGANCLIYKSIPSNSVVRLKQDIETSANLLK
jgi:acetyltransferase-like isoleucine patch superfamily enzyme